MKVKVNQNSMPSSGWETRVKEAYLVVALNVGRVVRDGIGNAKVNELQLAAHEDEVRGLEI